MSAPMLDRREALLGLLGSGSLLALGLDSRGAVVSAAEATAAAAAPTGIAPFGTWLSIGADGTLTLVSPEVEFGQGVATANAMLVCEELDGDWQKVVIVQSEHNPVYANPYHRRQATDSSAGMRKRYDQMRQIGASARVMLLQAAAMRWSVPVGECTTAAGVVRHAGSNRSARYGELAADAAKVAVPKDVALKAPGQWRLMGTHVRRLDAVEKSTGQARYASDMRFPNLRHAAFQRSPVLGGVAVSYAPGNVLSRPGVRQIVNVGYGVAVIADDAWTARKAAEELQVTWNDGPNATLSSAGIAREFADALAKTTPVVAKNTGDFDAAARAAGVKTLEATYIEPYLTHMVMEPTASCAWMHDGLCEFWTPTAETTNLLKAMDYCFGLKSEQVKIHRAQYVGGSFGLRGRVDADLEAAQLSRLTGWPIAVQRRREDDVQHGWFRPYQQIKLRGLVDGAGKIVGWHQKQAMQGLADTYLDEFAPFGANMQMAYTELRKSPYYATPYDAFTPSGTPFNTVAYQFPHVRCETVLMRNAMPVTFWRGVGYSNNVFQTECFIDELAQAGGRDPLAVRRELCAGNARALAVLDVLAKRIGWKWPQTSKKGEGWGLAYSDGFETFSALAVQLAVRDRRVTIKRMVCVFDQGVTVNPNQTEAQAQGGLIDGLAQAFFGEITVDKGRVQQGNLNDYPLWTLALTPPIDIVTLPSSERPGSITEMMNPLVPPAIANALYVATGERIRELPLRKLGYEVTRNA